jgi:hypothetical protein
MGTGEGRSPREEEEHGEEDENGNPQVHGSTSGVEGRRVYSERI